MLKEACSADVEISVRQIGSIGVHRPHPLGIGILKEAERGYNYAVDYRADADLLYQPCFGHDKSGSAA